VSAEGHSVFENLQLNVSILFQVGIPMLAQTRSRSKVRFPVSGFTRSDFTVF